jgi:hypothetical protein
VNRTGEERAQRDALGILLYQSAVEERIRAQWTDDVMRVTGQPVTQKLQIVELPMTQNAGR